MSQMFYLMIPIVIVHTKFPYFSVNHHICRKSPNIPGSFKKKGTNVSQINEKLIVCMPSIVMV